MKTQSLVWTPFRTVERSGERQPAMELAGASRVASRLLLAAVPALALLVFSTWLVMQPALVVYLQALLWSSGFVFAGLAVDAPTTERAVLNLLTAVALPVLAFVSSRLAPEVAIVGTTLVALWIAAAIFRR
jgi:hypothetical protein